MKKILGISAMAIALAGLMSCGSTSGAAKDDPNAVALVPHPRTYVVDMSDGKSTNTGAVGSGHWKFNQYGPNYQDTMSFTDLLKVNKPQAGDTIELHIKGVADKDVPAIFFNVVDTSAQANYWTVLTDEDHRDIPVENIKAGEVFEATFEIPVTVNMKGKFEVAGFYDDEKKGLSKIGEEVKITWERAAQTTDTTKESANVAPKGPQTIEIDIAKAAAFIDMATNLGSDGAKVYNYQAIINLYECFGDNLPKQGDSVRVKFKGTADRDIPKIMFTLVENTAAVNWWADLVADTNEEKFYTFAENVVSGQPFEVDVTVPICRDAIEGVSIQIFYDPGEGMTSSYIRAVQ